MGLHAASRSEVFTALADEVLHNYGHGRTMVAVDGMDDAATTVFADGLADAFRFLGHATFRASMDKFHKPRAERDWHGRDTPKSYYQDSYDYSLLRRVLTDPYRMGGSTGFVTAGFDEQRDTPIEPKWMTGPQDAVLLVDGVFLNRPELRGMWHYSIFLQAPQPLALSLLAMGERSVGLDPEPGNPTDARNSGAQALYFAEAKPREVATAIIDNSDPEHPRRVFADSC